MTQFAEVRHEEWIAAAVPRVRAQFADLQHHIDTKVHPKLEFRILPPDAGGRGAGPGAAGAVAAVAAVAAVDAVAADGAPVAARYEQRVRLLGITQRDVFERRFTADGGMVDTSVEGFNRGGSLRFGFEPERRDGAEGTLVHITIRLPLPPLVGPLLRPLLEAQVRKEVAAAAAEDKHDIEVRGYRPASVRDTAAQASGAAPWGLVA